MDMAAVMFVAAVLTGVAMVFVPRPASHVQRPGKPFQWVSWIVVAYIVVLGLAVHTSLTEELEFHCAVGALGVLGVLAVFLMARRLKRDRPWVSKLVHLAWGLVMIEALTGILLLWNPKVPWLHDVHGAAFPLLVAALVIIAVDGNGARQG